MFTDSHCHIFKEYYDNIDQIIKNANKVGVEKLMTCGCNYKSNLETIELVSKYKNVYGAIGIHPTEISDVEKDLLLIEKNVNNKKIVAIGEIGLDYHYEGFNKEEQKKVLKLMLDLAVKYNKPVIIHSRDANDDMYDILKDYNLKGVIHSFSGDTNMALKFIKLGYFIGINGIVTFKNSELINVIKDISVNNILVETDSPYLSPVPFRGAKNEPKNVLEIIKFLSQNLVIEEPVLGEILAKNLAACFDI